MSPKVMDWLKGLAAAFVGGGATAFAGGTAAAMLDPGLFNLSDGLAQEMKLFGSIFLISVATHVLAYLQRRPTPWDGNPDTDQRKP